MLDQVVLQTVVAKTFDITAVDPNEILIVKSISGLSAPKVTLFTGSYAGDGGYYQGRRVEQRNPVFTFKINPDYENDIEVTEIRRMLYRWFLNTGPLAGDGLKVTLKDSKLPDIYFIGNTEDINTDMWTKEQTAQVSMLAVDPFLRSEELYHWNGAGSNSLAFEYEGDAPTGLDIQVRVAVATPQVHLRLTQGAIVQNLTLVNPSGNFAAGSVVYVNTSVLSRSIMYGGADVMTMLAYGSDWLSLEEGFYVLESYGTAYLDNKALLQQVEYRGAWWGV